MAVQEFNCPNCGAPIDYDGSDMPTVRCPFCSTAVIVPAELRPKAARQPAPMQAAADHPVILQVPAGTGGGSKAGGLLVAIFIVVILFGLAVVLVPLMLVNRSNAAVSQVIRASTQNPGNAQNIAPTQPAAPTSSPTLTPTPAFAQQKVAFGAKGIGQGLLNDARYITVDGSGTVYVADYQDGRIQAFDSDGKYLHGWQVGNDKTIIAGMAASYSGVLYVAFGGSIHRYEGASGALLGEVPYNAGPEFGALAVTADGGLVGVWYEGRWGLITSLQGHREDLVWFDAGGNVLRTQESFISAQTGELALDVLLAVDGLGKIYALSDGEIFKFDAAGKYVDRFPAQADPSAGMGGLSAIAVDGRGRVFVGGSRQVAIFSPDGRFLRSFSTDVLIRSLAFSQNGDLYVVSGDQVVSYSLGVLP